MKIFLSVSRHLNQKNNEIEFSFVIPEIPEYMDLIDGCFYVKFYVRLNNSVTVDVSSYSTVKIRRQRKVSLKQYLELVVK